MSQHSTSPRPESRRSPSNTSITPNRIPDLSLGNISTPTFPSSEPCNLSPPDYNSIATPSASAVRASQQSRNNEKQALRDAWREQADQLAQARHVQVPRITGSRSIEPSSNSNSNSGSSGENRVRLGISGADLSPTTSILSDQQRQVGRRGYLPEGMDVREALAKCEDPTLGWSLQFWVTIADPVTQHVFFACPASGQCSWDPPVGAFVVPRSRDGEWWELADSTRSNRSYYYNPLTGRTQWTRPGGDAFVIPLGLVQNNALPSRSRASPRNSARQSSDPTPPSPTHLSPYTAVTTPPRDRHRTTSLPSPVQTPRRDGASLPLSPRQISSPRISQPMASPPAVAFPEPYPTGSPQADNTNSRYPTFNEPDSRSQPLERRSPSDPVSVASQRTSTSNVPLSPLSIVDEGSGSETNRSDETGSNWWERRRSKSTIPKRFVSGPRSGQDRLLPEEDEEAETASKDLSLAQIDSGSSRRRDSDVPRPVLTDASVLPKSEPAEPIFVESSVRSKRLSSGWHPVLAADISDEIQNFQSDKFAEKYFATRRMGVLRTRVPLERIMEWQKSPITAPLLVLPKNLSKDAITTFKVIQHVMGERDRPVESARPVQGSSSALNLASLNLGGRQNNEGHPHRNGRMANGFSIGGSNNLVTGEGKTEKMVILEEIRWMIQTGVSGVETRDEIYSQLVKQLTKNPDHDATVLGFQLFCVLVNAFGPSKEFATFVGSLLQRNIDQNADGIGVMARYCIAKLDIIASRGGRGKVLTIGEIEHASDAAFYPSVYGESLERIMQLQASSYPNLKIPVILPFLTDGILALGGTQNEGIFRVPADADSVSELKSRIDRGYYQLNGIDDPHVAASLLKLWLRELEEPVVPTELYNEALAASKVTSECLHFVSLLPTYNRRVLLFVISFFQQFMRDEVVEITKMTPQNLALVLGPNILRTTSNHLETVFTNSSFESKFVLQLLEYLRPREVDPKYVPSHGPAMESGRTDRGYHREI